MLKSFALALLAALGWSSVALAEVPRVVASVKPIHALVSAVMGELGTPELIVDGAASPHTYTLKPSDAQALQSADLVFWTGHGLELFLEDAIATLAPKATIVELSGAPGITLLPPREGGTFEQHADEEEEVGHGEERDMHFFLDPANAKVMLAAIAESLIAADPEHAGTYSANAAAETAALDALVADVTAALAPVKDRPFVVFHDAYQYFEKRFGLNVAGSVTVSPEIAPGADRINAIRTKLKTLDAACVFSEPQFEPRVVDVIIEGTGAKHGVLDPEGATLEEGPGLYGTLIGNLAASLVECLGG